MTKANSSDYTGPVRILDGHPVPYSGTVQRQRADTGDWESISAASVLSEINDWLRIHRPQQKLVRLDGSYFFYGAEPLTPKAL